MTHIGGIVLAAGASSRFGRPKQLLQWAGKPLVARAVDAALEAGLEPVVVVLGCAAAQVRAELEDRAVQWVMNWRWEEGLSTSVRLGLAMLPPDTEGAIFLQCDQPLVTAKLLKKLILRFESTQAPIVYPTHAGQRSTPVLFDRALFPALAGVSGDKGGRSLIARYGDQAVSVEVDGLLLTDIDTPDDYERLLKAIPYSEAIPPKFSLAEIRHLIVDMDGVLWRGNEPVEGLVDFFDLLRQREIGFVLATNNASQRPDQYMNKLARFGVTVGPEHILTSAQATADYLASIAPPGARVHVLGMEGLRDALTAGGFTLVEEGAEYVVVGWAIDLTWRKLAVAALQIQAGATFIGTNPDVTFPSEVGPVPGNGAQLAALQAATGVAPLVIGKPEPWLYQEAMRRLGATPETTAVIGDRLDTDIAGGVRAGLRTILVLSGTSNESDLRASPVRPDLVAADIGELARLWKEEMGG